MNSKDSVYSDNFRFAFFKAISVPSMRKSFKFFRHSVFYNFFFAQFRAVLRPGKIPVSKIDHPLDDKIPFTPSWITIYLDFVKFWVRMLSFFIRRYGKDAYNLAADFIRSIGELYAHAAVVYKKNLSTTKRPFYILRPGFFVIHLTDPHLMCGPSLHIMIAIYTYKMFGVFAGHFNEEEKLKEQYNEMMHGALAICKAVLYIKQHSVNCIPSSLYALTCFCPELFTPQDADDITNLLLSPAPCADKEIKYKRVHPCMSPSGEIPEEAQEEIRSHIRSLYRKLLSEKENAKTWEAPILNLLRSMR